MAANVLNSSQAVRMSVLVVRAFVRLRETLAMHRELASKLAELESKFERHDLEIATLFRTIQELMVLPPEVEKPPIGFETEEKYRRLPKK